MKNRASAAAATAFVFALLSAGCGADKDNGAPSVASIEPEVGPAAGGTRVTITGSNFRAGSTVTFGGVEAANVVLQTGSDASFGNSGQLTITYSVLTCDTPSCSAGAAEVVVRNPDSGAGALTAGFTFVSAPSVASVVPSSGPRPGGTTVTIAGTGFQDGATVSFGGTAAKNVTFVDAMTIVCSTPEMVNAGPADVMVENPDSQSNTLAYGFAFIPPPDVLSVAPSNGPMTGGTAVTISGTGFQEGAIVRFNGFDATSVTVVNSTTITCVTPAVPTAGYAAVVVKNPDSQSEPLYIGFTYDPGPGVTAVAPKDGPPSGGTAVTITGTGFQAGATVRFNGTDATAVTYVNATTITCTTPAGTVGAASVVVANPDSQTGTLNGGFSYVSFIAVGAGQYHSLAVNSDGTAWGFGNGWNGRLGDGYWNHRYTPSPATGLSGVVAVTGGEAQSYALKNDGTVWGYGGNWYGHIGDGTTSDRGTPVQVTGLTGIVSIASKAGFAIAAKSDGTVWAWGYNGWGQLGDGTSTNRNTPVQVSGLSGIVTKVSTGGNHSIALRNDGTVWAWGGNWYGQCGDGTTNNRSTPVQVSGLTGVIAVSGGWEHSLALKNDGTVWAWGRNYEGQLGDGTTSNRTTPVQVSGLAGVSAVSGGMFHSVAMKSDGTVWGWGLNRFGELGDGTTTSRPTPVQVSGFSGGAAIAAGYHTIALKTDGTLWAWGRNNWGQLGDGNRTDKLMPAQTTGLTGVLAVAGERYGNLILKNDGTVWSHGENSSSNLGDGSWDDRYSPVQVSGLTGATAVTSGKGWHSAALRSDGTVWAWGSNGYGQCGDGTTNTRSTPVQASGLSAIVAVGAGDAHTLAVKDDGTVWAWGRNNRGQLGDGTTSNRYTAVQVSGLTGVAAVAGGYESSMALKSDGTVWTWGRNNYGQLGDGTTTDRSTPVQVSGLSGVTKIACGYYHMLALKSDGTAWAWGCDWSGRLGDGVSVSGRYTPIQVPGLSGVTDIAAGETHTVALKSDGTVWAWGWNYFGQLGDGLGGTSTERRFPGQMPSIAGAVGVSAGWMQSIILLNDGTVWVCGYNGNGQVGDGTHPNSSTPVAVH